MLLRKISRNPLLSQVLFDANIIDCEASLQATSRNPLLSQVLFDYLSGREFDRERAQVVIPY